MVSAGYAWLQVRVWDRRLGATYQKVEALGLDNYGFPEVFWARAGAACVPEHGASQPLLGFRPFSLIPEPSVCALWALGSLVLSWNRWRRRCRLLLSRPSGRQTEGTPAGQGGLAAAGC